MSTGWVRAAATATVAVLCVSACASTADGVPPRPATPRPATSTGSWHLGGSSATAVFRPLPVPAGWGPTAAEIARAQALVGGLSLRQRAGQVVVAAYHGTGSPAAFVDRLHLGGVVVFSENVVDAAQITGSNRALQRSAASAGREWPVLVGVDQEGGRVARVVSGATAFPTLMTAGAADDPALTRRAYAASGGELTAMGFNVDFAPDADVTVGPSDPTIGARSAGSAPERVAAHATAAMKGFATSGLVPVLKHFPGHGSVTTDSHVGLPVQRKSLHALSHSDLVPFRAGIVAGASAVMVGHLDVRAVDPGTPSSLSRRVVTGLLRERMGFHGVAFSDSLEMGAVRDRFGSAASAVRAIRAGEDVVLMPPDPRAARDGIAAAVRDGRLPQARLDQAATRVVALLLHQRDTAQRGTPAGSSAAVSRQLSAAGLTSVAGPCSGRLVGRRVRVTGPGSAVARFRAVARAAGLKVARHRGTKVRLVGYPNGSVRGDVVVAMDTPYVLGRSRARVAKLATYGDTPEAMSALVSVLLGHARAPGHLPVVVPALPRSGC
jgi:beta-N-acetylhexosaminidase